MRIKIGEISKKSGVPPSTIRYYVRQGLLPEPEKVNKSMAYYDESCIEKVRTIRYLQEMKYYPLSVIQNILRRMDEGLSLEEAEAIEDAVFGHKDDIVDKLIEREEFIRVTGLVDEDIDEAMDIGILVPYIQENGRTLFDMEDVRFGRDILKPIKDLGQDITELGFYVELGKKIVDNEILLRKKAVKGRSQKDNIFITSEISKKAEFFRSYIMKRLFQRRVQDTIQKSFNP